MAAGAPPLPPYVVHTGPFPLSHYDEVNNRFIILIQQQPLSAAAEALSSVHPNAVARLNAWTLLLQPVVAQWLLTRPPVTRVATSQLIEFAKPSGAVANGSGMGVFAWRNNGMISRCQYCPSTITSSTSESTRTSLLARIVTRTDAMCVSTTRSDLDVSEAQLWRGKATVLRLDAGDQRNVTLQHERFAKIVTYSIRTATTSGEDHDINNLTFLCAPMCLDARSDYGRTSLSPGYDQHPLPTRSAAQSRSYPLFAFIKRNGFQLHIYDKYSALEVNRWQADHGVVFAHDGALAVDVCQSTRLEDCSPVRTSACWTKAVSEPAARGMLGLRSPDAVVPTLTRVFCFCRHPHDIGLFSLVSFHVLALPSGAKVIQARASFRRKILPTLQRGLHPESALGEPGLAQAAFVTYLDRGRIKHLWGIPLPPNLTPAQHSACHPADPKLHPYSCCLHPGLFRRASIARDHRDNLVYGTRWMRLTFAPSSSFATAPSYVLQFTDAEIKYVHPPASPALPHPLHDSFLANTYVYIPFEDLHHRYDAMSRARRILQPYRVYQEGQHDDIGPLGTHDDPVWAYICTMRRKSDGNDHYTEHTVALQDYSLSFLSTSTQRKMATGASTDERALLR